MKKTPVRIAVTGAAGQIAYSLLFRIASGDMLGKDQPVILQLLELPQGQKKLKGVIMELEDCAFPLLAEVHASDDPNVAFKNAQIAMLVGARPRGPGMERKDLLAENAKIFKSQGDAIGRHADPDCRVLVVGNPCNTNAYIAIRAATPHGRIKSTNFTAMLRLDHNRALAQLAAKTGRDVSTFRKLAVWGNHSPTMYADYRFCESDGEKVKDMIHNEDWNREVFMPTVGKRGAAVIEARGLSSAASAANAAIDHMHDWWFGSNGDWVTMGVVSDGSYDVPEGLIFGFPCIAENGSYEIVHGLDCDDFSHDLMERSVKELQEEMELVEPLLD